ncbi:MAG: class I tRNA ligase family protein, partial [Candidatus Fimadaptatus sp.]
DEDVLDTWFSSALWPFSTMGWPDETEDLKYFYPTNALVTGYDIITFWVSRMITCGVEAMGETPFETVLIHGLVRDEQGRKMSKSLGNGIDPLEIVDKYGADALRFSLALGVSPGNDMRVSEKKFDACRNFANKVWNASRFVVMNLDGQAVPLEGRRLTLADKWILGRFNEAVRVITGNLDDYDTGNAAQKIYDFAWSEFCDWYIELAKPRLLGDDAESRDTVRAVLEHVLIGMLKLLHPFMPFLTDAVYRYLPGTEGSIMLKSWPEYRPEYEFAAESERMQGIMDVINSVRNLRATMNVAPSRRAHMILRAKEGWRDALEEGIIYFKRLAGASEVSFIGEGETVDKAASAVCACGDVFIPLGELVDVEAELKRLAKEQKSLEGEIARGEGKLNNTGFMSKAPAALVEQEKQKLTTNREMLESVKARIKEMESL